MSKNIYRISLAVGYTVNYISAWQSITLFRAINNDLELDFLEAAFQKRSANIKQDWISTPTQKNIFSEGTISSLLK